VRRTSHAAPGALRFLTPAFALALFLNGALLFTVQLMVARRLLPRFGGAPAVWVTCAFVFQTLLVLGYAYARLLGSRARPAVQYAVHLLLLAAACLFIPIAFPASEPSADSGNPTLSVIRLLLGAVGVPFFLLSAASPLLQQWFAQTAHPAARDPYFLYSASNLGSLLGLLGYPLGIEPHMGLASQGTAWGTGFLVAVALTALCAGLVWRCRRPSPADALAPPSATAGVEPPPETGKDLESPGGSTCRGRAPSGGTLLRWALLAFVPSSLTLGVTSFLSTDVAAFPLAWVIPLTLYLLSFILVFARVGGGLQRWMVRLLPVGLAVLIFAGAPGVGLSVGLTFAIHLLALFLVCMVCHGMLAQARPAPERLGAFYLGLAIGGALGGVFNALVAPVVFPQVFEYPLVLVLAALLLPAGAPQNSSRASRWKTGLGYFGSAAAMAGVTAWMVTKGYPRAILEGLNRWALLPPDRLAASLAAGTVALLCYAASLPRRRGLFGLCFAAALLTVGGLTERNLDIIRRERSFFGVLTVTREGDGAFHKLYHGNTLHGKQATDPRYRHLPLSYYHPRGPTGDAFEWLRELRKGRKIAVVGLGAGVLAAYTGPAQEIDFYEIDPAVIRIARDPACFTFLRDCKASWRTIPGDGRLMLDRAPERYYDLIILDAFSSDAIPVHLLTREAFHVYFSRLRIGGLLLAHISSRYVDLAPVLAGLAAAEDYAVRIREDSGDPSISKDSSTWVLLARNERDLRWLAARQAWRAPQPQRGISHWTDDYADPLSVMRFW